MGVQWQMELMSGMVRQYGCFVTRTGMTTVADAHRIGAGLYQGVMTGWYWMRWESNQECAGCWPATMMQLVVQDMFTGAPDRGIKMEIT